MFKFRNTNAFKSICLILACSILLTSCHTIQYVSLQDEYNAQLNGKKYAEIVELLGPPDRTTPDGKGGEILVYELKSQEGYSGGKYSNSIHLTEKKKQTNVYLDENKVCYKVNTDDVKPVEVFSKGKTVGLVVPLVVGTLLLILIASEDSSSSTY